MLKQEKIDITQTNMALFGTDVEKKLKNTPLKENPPGRLPVKKLVLKYGVLRNSKLKNGPKINMDNSMMETAISFYILIKRKINSYMMCTFG
jgi:hypothetical protein